jgi:hypothetical protein
MQMKNAKSGIGPALIAASIFAGACASLPDDIALKAVNRWEAPSAAAGRQLLDEYGLPDDVTPNQLTWDRHGAWKRTVVWNRVPIYRSPAEFAVMKQTVDYPLNLQQTSELLAFSGGLQIDLERGELSSSSMEEKLNYLTMNLADEIARGLKTVPEARAAYARVLALEAAGKSSPYTDGLLFSAGR